MEFWTLAAEYGPGIVFAVVVFFAYQKQVKAYQDLTVQLVKMVESNTTALVNMYNVVAGMLSHSEKLDEKLVKVLETNTEAIESGATALGALGVQIESLEKTVDRVQK